MVGEKASAYAVHTAQYKAQEVSQLFPESLILGADTVVSLDDHIFGKPQSNQEALAFLEQLRGKTHDVITGCALLYKGIPCTFFCTTQVTFWQCPDELLYQYAMDDEVLDKAGAYAIQGKGSFLVKEISGSWSNVVGLPVAELVETLVKNNFFRSIL